MNQTIICITSPLGVTIPYYSYHKVCCSYHMILLLQKLKNNFLNLEDEII